MRVRLRDRLRTERAVDLRDEDVSVADVVDALGLDPTDPLSTATTDPPSLTRALAAAARTRGHNHPADERLATLTRRLESTGETPDAVEEAAAALSTARERAATAGADVDRLRERVATLRGKRELVGADTIHDDTGANVDEEFTVATRALTEAETERVAATQALAHATERVRETRDAREHRLRLRDAIANRRQEARRGLSTAVYAAFSDAYAAIPGAESADGLTGATPREFAGDSVVGHLAATRIARRDGPVAVACSTFEDAAEASEVLHESVVLVAHE